MSDDELEVVDAERRRALARLGLALPVAYAAPVLLQLRAAVAEDDDDEDDDVDDNVDDNVDDDVDDGDRDDDDDEDDDDDGVPPAPKGRGW